MYSSSTANFCFSIILWIQLVKTSNLCHKVIFCILNKTAGNLCARKCWGDIFWRGVWISGKRKKEKWQSIYFSPSLLFCLLLSNKHLLLKRRCYQPLTSWLCKTPSVFPDKQDIWGAAAVHCAVLCSFLFQNTLPFWGFLWYHIIMLFIFVLRYNNIWIVFLVFLLVGLHIWEHWESENILHIGLKTSVWVITF